MTNLETLRKKCKFHIQDVKITDDEIDELIYLAIEDIANTTKLFKKLYGFTVYEEMKIYDFEGLTTLNERVEEELSAISMSPITDKQIADACANNTLPSPVVNKELFIEWEGQSNYIDILDIFDENGRSVFDQFYFHGTSEYFCENDEWRKENENKQFVYVATVIPNIDELLPNDLREISSTVIQGVKYYNSDTLESQGDTQVSNIFYQRFWSKMNGLVDKRPTQVFSVASTKRERIWP